jgi:hypothetical protein
MIKITPSESTNIINSRKNDEIFGMQISMSIRKDVDDDIINNIINEFREAVIPGTGLEYCPYYIASIREIVIPIEGIDFNILVTYSQILEYASIVIKYIRENYFRYYDRIIIEIGAFINDKWYIVETITI